MKKYTSILQRVHENTAWNKVSLTFSDIKDKSVALAIIREKYVIKDSIGRYTLTQKGLIYLGLAKREAKGGYQHGITQKRLSYMMAHPNKTSREYRNALNITDTAFFIFAKNHNLIRTGTRGKYTYALPTQDQNPKGQRQGEHKK